jgi:hypothetical protein
LYIARGAPGFDAASLRQGDILAGIPFVLLEHAKTHIIARVLEDYPFGGPPHLQCHMQNHRDDAEWVLIQALAKYGFCSIISHCCDLEPRAGGRVVTPAINFARLRPVTADIRNNAARFASLRSNADPRNPAGPVYFDRFYLEAHPDLNNTDWIVHYNQIVTIPVTTQDVAILLAKKVLQLDDRTRAKFKIKLATSLGRLTDEEINAGLANPWAVPAPALEPELDVVMADAAVDAGGGGGAGVGGGAGGPAADGQPEEANPEPPAQGH